jgi:26S proteasome regulatory subunit N7
MNDPAIRERIKKADEKIAAVSTDQGDLEIRDAYLEKAEIYLDINDMENYRANVHKALEKAIGNAKKLGLNLLILNTYWKQRDFEMYEKTLEICRKLTDDSLDWEKKNKLAIYESIQKILKREMEDAATTLIACVDTFNSPEIMTFKELVAYAVVLGVLWLPRKEIREKIMQNPEINSILKEFPVLNDFRSAVFNMNYLKFFELLIRLSDEYLSTDVLLSKHRQSLLRRARIIIYTLFLESYKTVKLKKMAESFGVSFEFLDKEIADLISQKQLNCKIDRVNWIVEAVRVDERSAAYNEIERRGDALVERLHKLMKRTQD